MCTGEFTEQETRDGETKYSQCSVYDLDYDSYTTEELARWDRADMMNNTATRKCDSWVYDQSVFTSSAVSQVCIIHCLVAGGADPENLAVSCECN